MVLKRLIDNAIKYNKQGFPEVWINFKIEGEHSILSVKDNGIGIAPDFQKKIFDMFTRLHNRGAYSGTGMGLSYCKKLLSNYGGTITVESVEGEGSTFNIIIPTKTVYGEQDRIFVSTIKSSITTDN
jgi:signal transduction histidine kinase